MQCSRPTFFPPRCDVRQAQKMSEGRRTRAAGDCSSRTPCCYPQLVNLKLGCCQIPKETATWLPWETAWPHRGSLRIKEDQAPFSSLQKKCVMPRPQKTGLQICPSFAFELTALLKGRPGGPSAVYPHPCPCPTPTPWLRSLSEPSRANASFHTKNPNLYLRHCFAWKQQL